MKIVDTICSALNVDYSNQRNAVKSSLGFLFSVLEREETENEIHKHANNACFRFSETIANHSLP